MSSTLNGLLSVSPEQLAVALVEILLHRLPELQLIVLRGVSMNGVAISNSPTLVWTM